MKYIDRALVLNPLYVGICTSEKQLMKEIKKLNVQDPIEFLNGDADSSVHLIPHEGSNVAIVTMASLKGRTDVEIAGLFARQAVVVWQATRLELGENFIDDKLEADSIQKIMQQLMWAHAELKAKKKK